MADEPIIELENIYGKFKEKARYLGKVMSLNKQLMWKELKGKVLKQCAEIGKIVKKIPVQPGRVLSMVSRSLMAFHVVLLILTRENSMKEIDTILNMMVKYSLGLPRNIPTAVIEALMPTELPLLWIKRIAQKLALKVAHKRPDLGLQDLLIGGTDPQKYTGCMFHLMTHQTCQVLMEDDQTYTTKVKPVSKKNLWSRNSRYIMVYSTANVFPNDYSETDYLYECGANFDRKHRLF